MWGVTKKRFAEYGLASSLKPDLPGIQGDAFYARLQVCEWVGYEQDRAQLIFAVRNGRTGDFAISISHRFIVAEGSAAMRETSGR